MNCYEHTLIARQDLVESQNKDLTDKYQKIIEDNSGKVLKIEKWGIKNLTHKIKNNQKGFYIHIKFEGSKKSVDEIEKAEIIDVKVLRFLTVKVKKHDLETNFFEKKEFNKPLDVNEKK